MAGVVPAWEVAKALDQAGLVEQRKADEKAWLEEALKRVNESAGEGAVLDSAGDDEDWTHEDFMRDLRKASGPVEDQ
jgi:hypothetical protein